MAILANGKTGIGTNNPQSLLDVAGNINTSTQYNIGGNRVLSTPGSQNLFAGVGAGQNNSTGSDNSFFGNAAGQSNTSGNNNTVIGAFAQLDANNLSYATAIGAGSEVSTSNTITLGRLNRADSVSVPGNLTTSGTVSGYSVDAETQFTIGGAHMLSIGQNGSESLFFGDGSGELDATGSANTLIGGHTNLGASNLINATAIGHRAQVSQSNSLVLGSINGTNSANADTNVGIGTTSPAKRLHVTGPGSDGAGQTDVRITGTGPTASGITLESTGTGGRTYSWLSTAVNAGGGGAGGGRLALFDVTAGVYRMVIDGTGNVAIGTFTPDRTLTVNGTADKVGGGSWDTFSDERLKNIKGRFTPGLKALMQLQPLRYEYKPDNALGLKSSGEHIGFGAQAVQKIIPEAVSKNDKGYLLLNNDPILWTMLNAIKEQQQQITQQQAAAKQQQDQIAALRAANTALNTRLRLIERTLKNKRGPTRHRR